MYYFDEKTQLFYDNRINEVPKTAIELSEKDFYTGINLRSQGKILVYNKGFKTIEKDSTSKQKYYEALQYLKDTDRYFTVDNYSKLEETKKNELTLNRENARIIVREYESKWLNQ